ncbi:sugar phosphate isomerase/epimerase [Paenibacillus elgii]|uniref:sugar phosphate isomerase/epimerase family protein n=1 Tax=Paenibacillus elgii TaxID=189691 RepID=UPI002D7C99D0|nr:sugar phosphate isomerase/epimerase [Paenibacillus elgii]
MVMGTIPLTRLAGMNEHFPLYTLDYFLDAMVELGLEHIELWGGSPHLYVEDVTLRQVGGIRREIERRGLNVICFTPEQCVYPVNIAAREKDIRERSLRYFTKALEAAAELGSDLLQIVPGWGYRSEPVGEAWERSRDSLQQLSRKAEELGMTMVLEQLEPFESNLVTNTETQARMLQEVGSDRLKAIVDTCPMHAAGETFDDCFQALGNDLRHIHFIDSDHLTWGDGRLPLRDYLNQLSKHGYPGYLTLEICAERYLLDPVAPLKKGLQAVREALCQ